MEIQELFAYMSTFFCFFCVFKYTSFYDFVLIEAKKYNDNYRITFGSEEETKENETTQTNVEPVIIVKYEDKYLEKFLQFSNEYNFTEEELLAEQFTIINNKHIWENNLKKDINELQKQLAEVLPIFEAGSSLGLNDKVCIQMGKYFKVDETEYLAEDLFNDIKELKTELATQLDVLLTDKDIPDFEKDARDLTINNKLDTFINNYILEMTPLGNVYMRYNNNKKSFEYFSNNTIPYRYLEAVGRKYVMTFWCKALFVNLADELTKAEQKQIEEKKESNEKSVPINPIKKQSFSSKNHTSKPNVGANATNAPLIKGNNIVTNTKPDGAPILLKENANRYTWEGRLANLMLLKKAEKKTTSLSFAEFKLLQKTK